MASKLFYLLMDCETFNQLPELEQARGVIRALQVSTVVLFTKIVRNVNLKTKKIILRCLAGSSMCLYRQIHYSP